MSFGFVMLVEPGIFAMEKHVWLHEDRAVLGLKTDWVISAGIWWRAEFKK